MMKSLITAATLGSAVLVAAPAAAAQYYPPQPQRYAYNQPGQGQGRQLEMRLQQVRREIRDLDRRNILSEREARRLEREAQQLDWRIRRLAANGVNWNERAVVERQIAQLEMRVRREATDGNRRFGYNAFPDRDRDGRDDRREDDRGTRHDN